MIQDRNLADRETSAVTVAAALAPHVRTVHAYVGNMVIGAALMCRDSGSGRAEPPVFA
jgi:hypothetical protein